MGSIVSKDITKFLQRVGPDPDSVIKDMETYADENDFPIVGSAVGGWLCQLTQLSESRSIFEFGSGFGYSAYWFSRALPDNGQIVLTDHDAQNLNKAETFFDRSDFEGSVHFEHGDAIETVQQYSGPFDIVLLDNEKDRYKEAFESVREKVAPGGLVITDNSMMTTITVDFEELHALVRGEDIETHKNTTGIAELYEAIGRDPAFDTTVLPIGDGVAVSYKNS